MKKRLILLASMTLIACGLVSCVDDSGQDSPVVDDETYSGGKLGTTFNQSASAFEDPTPAVEQAGLVSDFKSGERFFEHTYTQNTEPFKGLGPLYCRASCESCHPGYGHGRRMTRYRADEWGNGYLLIVSDRDGRVVESLGVVPMTKAVPPFKPMIDEEKVRIVWNDYVDEWNNTFPDGERYGLVYPEVIIPEDAFYAPLEIDGRTVAYSSLVMTLESTIGIYGTGLIDAIPDDSLKAEYQRQASHNVPLNPAIWAGNDWASVGADGHPFRLDYALDATSTQGNVSLWEVTNVVSPAFTYNYLPEAYCRTAAADPDVQQDFYTYFPGENHTGNVQEDIYNYLSNPNIVPEMSATQVYQLNLWIRGLAVPAARNLADGDVQRGRKLFREMGCASCHRPGWTTGSDSHLQDPYGIVGGREMPRYPYQKIWPYSDFVQHRLRMVNDIRTGWCRTTPLWGRGLSPICSGHADRLHDCRARNVIEAIMWHGSPDSDARWSVENFRKLSKADRDAVVKFINAI